MSAPSSAAPRIAFARSWSPSGQAVVTVGLLSDSCSGPEHIAASPPLACDSASTPRPPRGARLDCRELGVLRLRRLGTALSVRPLLVAGLDCQRGRDDGSLVRADGILARVVASLKVTDLGPRGSTAARTPDSSTARPMGRPLRRGPRCLTVYGRGSNRGVGIGNMPGDRQRRNHPVASQPARAQPRPVSRTDRRHPARHGSSCHLDQRDRRGGGRLRE